MDDFNWSVFIMDFQWVLRLEQCVIASRIHMFCHCRRQHQEIEMVVWGAVHLVCSLNRYFCRRFAWTCLCSSLCDQRCIAVGGNDEGHFRMGSGHYHSVACYFCNW